MNNYLNFPTPLTGFTVPILPETYNFAQQQSTQQTTPQKQEQVLQHLLAVLAVETYCQYMDIPTERTQSNSFDPIYQSLTEAADLYLSGLGRIECRHLQEPAPTLADDCLGVVVVQWQSESRTMQLLGFITAETLQPGQPLSDYAPLDQLFERIEQLELHLLQIPLSDPVMQRVQQRLQTQSLSALVIRLERLLHNSELDEDDRQYELGNFLAGREPVGASREEAGMLLSSEDSNTEDEELLECLELAEDLFDRLGDWWDSPTQP